MPPARVLTVLLGIVLLSGCDSFSSDERAAPDGSVPPEAGTPESGSDAAPPIPTGLVDGSFEQSSNDTCAGLQVFRAVAKPEGPAATGQRACRICADDRAQPSMPGGAILSYVPGGTVAPGVYRARLSARKPPAPAAGTPDFGFALQAYQGAGILAQQPTAPSPIVASGDYQTHLRVLEVGATVDRLELVVSVGPRASECLLVDDLLLTRD